MKQKQTMRNGVLVKSLALMAAALLALPSSGQGLVDLTSPTGGTITNSPCLATYEGTKAFDNGALVDASRWLAKVSAFPNVYVQYQFNSGPVLVNAYRLTGLTSSSFSTRAPKDFSLLGSHDGTGWVELHSQTGVTGWADGQQRYYAFPNDTAYAYYRFIISANNGDGTYTGLNELEFFLVPSPPAIENLPASNVLVDSGWMNGSLSVTGTAATAVMVYWGSSDGGTTASAWANTNTWAAPQEADAFTWQATGLSTNNTCYYRYAATNDVGLTWASETAAFITGEVWLEWVSDGDEATFAPGTFRVVRGEATTNAALSVYYAQTDGTAISGVDFAALSGQVVIPAGETSAVISVTPIGNYADPNDKTVTLSVLPQGYLVGAPAAATLTIENQDVPADKNVWVAPSAGNASVAANWSQGVPTAGDDILLDLFSTADMTWDAGVNGLPDTVASWTQTADYTGTVTFPINFTNVVDAVFTNFTITGNAVIDGGSWTHPEHADSPTAMRKDFYRLRVQIGGALSVGTGGSISATAKGSFRAYNGSGGAYGGNNNYGGSMVYGDPVEPVHVGSSAFADNVQNAGAGGAVWLEVAGATTLDGALAANGVTAAGQWADIYAGSGGSIFLKTASLSGGGTISANGSGSGGSKCKDIGSGGRVSILLTGSEMAFPIANVKAISGGAQYNAVGGAGTVVVRTPAMPNGVLRVVNKSGMYGMYAYRPRTSQLTAIPAGGTWNFDALVTGDNGILSIPDGTTLSLPNGLESVSSSSAERENGLFLSGGTLTLPEQPTHTLSGAWMLQANTLLAISGNVVVTNGAAVGTLRLYNASTNSCTQCALSVSGDMTVAHDAYVYAVNGGYASKDATTPNGSGGYGSHGGQNAQYATSTVYGSILDPGMAGTFGGTANYAPYGGGNVQLEVGGTLTVNGLATAGVATPSNGRPGGGGTLNIVAARLSGIGSIHANGNLRNYKDGDQHGASGGGRVAVRLTDPSAEFSDHWKSAINAKGCYTSASTLLAAYSSSAGTVYLQSGGEAEAAGTIIVRNDNDSRNNVAFTPVPSRRHGGEADAFDKASFAFEDYARVKLHESFKAESLSMESGTALDLAGMALTLRSMQAGGENVPAGTYSAGSTLFTDGFVSDSVGGGQVLVLGAGTVMVVR